MNLEKLPIGIQSFVSLREGGYAYVDKTPYIERLADSGKYYFLSRPRRFGKSLFLDSLDCAFSGRRELFSGLYLDSPESGWDWSEKNLVLRVDWSAGLLRNADDLQETLFRKIDDWSALFGLGKFKGTPGQRMESLVRSIAESRGQKVVVLVDEYDKPILDNIEDTGLAARMRDALKDFYGSLKPLDPYLRFVFLTGVSKFAKTGIFSGLNNLNDITLDKDYSAICGYTQGDLETVFTQRLSAFDKEAVRSWYNGYSWTGETVYNPFDALLLFDKGDYRPYWFETGTPTFLVKLLSEKPRSLPDLDGLVVGDDILGSFALEDLKPETLLFQSGYLTIKSWTSDAEEGTRYTLGFPNREVRESFCRLMLDFYGGSTGTFADRRVRSALDSGDGASLRSYLHAFFASIPHDWYRKNAVSAFEGYYASVVYAFFASLGLEAIPEDTTNKGRIDLAVKTRKSIWLFEFKVRGLDRSGDRNPLAQLRDRGYAEKYRAAGLPLREVGIVFDAESRNIEAWEEGWEKG